MSRLPAPLPAAQVDAATAVRRLGNALIAHAVDDELLGQVAKQLGELTDAVGQCPPRSKAEAFHQYGHQRVETFLETGEWPPPPAEGEAIEFDLLSFVGGSLNPFSAGMQVRREGDEAVSNVRFGRCYEGPPERAHGGILAAAFDEVMGSVFRVLGVASAFTGTLSVRYVAAAPIDEELELRARLVATEGRKNTVEATATGPDGVVATATGLFIEMKPGQMPVISE